jgi:hypothetical protein
LIARSGRVASFLVGAALLSACTGAPTPSATPALSTSSTIGPIGGTPTRVAQAVATPLSALTPAGTATAGPPAIRIVSPTPGQTVSGNRLDVRVETPSFLINFEKMSQAPEAGAGHWHVYVDNRLAGMVASDVVSLPNDTMPEIAAGPHEIRVQLHHHDHTAVGVPNDRVMVNFPETLRYQAQPGPPSVRFLEPRAGETVGPRLLLRVQVGGARLDSINVGRNPAPGAGHWLLYVDGRVAGLSACEVVSLPNDTFPTISDGPHTLRVELRTNDGAPFPNASSDEIRINYRSR